jgi:ribosomal protein L37AE/L43A
MPRSKDKKQPICHNCKTKLTAAPEHKFYECLKCGLLMLDDGYVIYDPKDPKWRRLMGQTE